MDPLASIAMASDYDSVSDSGSRHDSSSVFKNFVQRYSEEELATILIVLGGLLLFVPGVNLVGIVLVLVGSATWLSDWLWG